MNNLMENIRGEIYIVLKLCLSFFLSPCQHLLNSTPPKNIFFNKFYLIFFCLFWQFKTKFGEFLNVLFGVVMIAIICIIGAMKCKNTIILKLFLPDPRGASLHLAFQFSYVRPSVRSSVRL